MTGQKHWSGWRREERQFFSDTQQKKRSSFLNSVCAPPGAIVWFVTYWLSNTVIEINNRLTNSYFRLPFYSPLGSIRVRLSRLAFQRLWVIVWSSMTQSSASNLRSFYFKERTFPLGLQNSENIIQNPSVLFIEELVITYPFTRNYYCNYR